MLPLVCSMSLIFPNFDVKSIIFFPNFGQGPFPKIAGKSPVQQLFLQKNENLLVQ